MQLLKNPKFKFMKFKVTAFILSGIMIAIGITNITAGKGLNYGIDFAGGTLIRIMFKDPIPAGEVRLALENKGLGKSRIQQLGHSSQEYLIRTLQHLEGLELEEELEAHEIIGNQVVEALRSEEYDTLMEKGLLDLNNIDISELTSLLQSDFEDASEVAKQIIDHRVNQGIIHDFSSLQQETGVSSEIIRFLEKKTILGNLTVLSKETVGPQVGRDLRRKATQATIWALFGMLLYIGFRFKFAYGVSAILTLTHDVLITLGIFSLTNREINLPVIAAILTIVGYSLNDTIVIFDRIRDNLKILRKHPLEEIINNSLNQTLSRTFITSGTTFLTVLALFIFGGEVINDFAFTLIVGIIAGTYSSIYQSCPYLFYWNKLFKPKKGLRK